LKNGAAALHRGRRMVSLSCHECRDLRKKKAEASRKKGARTAPSRVRPHLLLGEEGDAL